MGSRSSDQPSRLFAIQPQILIEVDGIADESFGRGMFRCCSFRDSLGYLRPDRGIIHDAPTVVDYSGWKLKK